MNQPQSAEGVLADWISDAFNPAELRSFLLRTQVASGLLESLPTESVSAESFADELVAAFKRQGLIGRELFVALATARPLRIEGLLAAAARFPALLDAGLRDELIELAVEQPAAIKRPGSMRDALIRLQLVYPALHDALTLQIRKLEEREARAPRPAVRRRPAPGPGGGDGRAAVADFSVRTEHGVCNNDLEWTARQVCAALRARGAYTEADRLEDEVRRCAPDAKAARLVQILREHDLLRCPVPYADAVVFASRGFTKSFSRRGAAHFCLTCPALELRLGQLYAVVGANGSGKSTFLRCVGGILSTDREESLSYPDLDPGQSQRGSLEWPTVQASIYFVPQRLVPWKETVQNELRLHAARCGYRGSRNEERVGEVCKALALDVDHMQCAWGKLPGGFHTRLELAKAFISTAKLLIFDEPLAALDINAQTNFLEELRNEIDRRPRCLLISTQHIEEAEQATRNMFYLDGNGVVDVQPILDGTCFEVAGAFAEAGPFLDDLREFGSLWWVDRAHHTFHLTVHSEIPDLAGRIFATALRHSVKIAAFRDVSRSLLRTLKGQLMPSADRSDKHGG